jgi:hypothetical protein
LERGRQRHDLHCLLPLIGCFELLVDVIFHTEDCTVASAYTAKELIAIHHITNRCLISPETTDHWGPAIWVWTYGRPTCGHVAYSV